MLGFADYWDAHAHLIAPSRFAVVYSRACPPGTSVDVDSLIPSGELFSLALPLTPERWAQFCRDQMRKAAPDGVEPYSWEIRQACEAFFEKAHA